MRLPKSEIYITPDAEERIRMAFEDCRQIRAVSIARPRRTILLVCSVETGNTLRREETHQYVHTPLARDLVLDQRHHERLEFRMVVRIHSEEWHSRIDYTRSIAVGASLSRLYLPRIPIYANDQRAKQDREGFSSFTRRRCYNRPTVTACLRVHHVVKHNVQYSITFSYTVERTVSETLSRRQVCCSCPQGLEILLQLHHDVCQKLNLIPIPCGSSSLFFSSR